MANERKYTIFFGKKVPPYMNLHEPDFSGTRIYFPSYESFNDSWKVIE